MATMSPSHHLPSPAPSAASPAASIIGIGQSLSALPAPRAHPLKPGSQKEIALINYVDDKILRINRRYAKKFTSSGENSDDLPGYTEYSQVVQDVSPIFDVVWISGTRKSTIAS